MDHLALDEGGAVAQQLRDRLVFELEQHPVANRQHLPRVNC